MIEKEKSYHLSGVHTLIIVVILVILVGVFFRFISIMQASMEEVLIQINLLNLQQMIHYQQLSGGGESRCQLLDKPDLFQNFVDPNAKANDPGAWQYDATKHQLIYNVRSKRYFRSELGQQIVVELYCKKGLISYKESSFQWCHDKKIWGCKAW